MQLYSIKKHNLCVENNGEPKCALNDKLSILVHCHFICSFLE